MAIGSADVAGNKRDDNVAGFNSAVAQWQDSDYQTFVNAIGARRAQSTMQMDLPILTLNASIGSIGSSTQVQPLPATSDTFDVVSQADYKEHITPPDRSKRVYYASNAVQVLPAQAAPGVTPLQLGSQGVLQVHHSADITLTFPPPEDASPAVSSTVTVSQLPTVISVVSNDPLCTDEAVDELECATRCDAAKTIGTAGRCVQFFRAESVCMTLSASNNASAEQLLPQMSAAGAVMPRSQPSQTLRTGCAKQHPLLSRSALQREGVELPSVYSRLMVADTDNVALVAFTPLVISSLSAAYGTNVTLPSVEFAAMADSSPYAYFMRSSDGTLDFGVPGDVVLGAALFLIGLGLAVMCCGAGVFIHRWASAKSRLAGYVQRAHAQGNTGDQLMAVIRDQDLVLKNLPAAQRTQFRMNNRIDKWLQLLREQTGFAAAVSSHRNPVGAPTAGHQGGRMSSVVTPASGGIELQTRHDTGNSMPAERSDVSSMNTKQQATLSTMPNNTHGNSSHLGAYAPAYTPSTSNMSPPAQAYPGAAPGMAYPVADSAYPMPQYAPVHSSFGEVGASAGQHNAPGAYMAAGPHYPPPAYGGADSLSYPSHK